MSDDTEKGKWDFAEKHLIKKEPLTPERVPNTVMEHVVEGGLTAPQGIIEKIKIGKLEREKRIQILTEKTKGQLEVWKHHVESQVVVAKQRIDLHVEGQLMEIGRQHLLNLQEIGMSNFDDRFRALQDLTTRSAEQMQRVNSMDVPLSMKQKLIDAVAKGYEQLFEKIQSEEIRTPPRKD